MLALFTNRGYTDKKHYVIIMVYESSTLKTDPFMRKTKHLKYQV